MNYPFELDIAGNEMRLNGKSIPYVVIIPFQGGIYVCEPRRLQRDHNFSGKEWFDTTFGTFTDEIWLERSIAWKLGKKPTTNFFLSYSLCFFLLSTSH